MRFKKNLKKFLAAALAVTCMLNTSMYAYAETTLHEAGTASITVTYNVVSTFEVSIPDSVTPAKEGTDVPIYGSGDIGGDETLEITTDNTLVMSSVGKEDVTLNLSQDVTTFTCEEVAANCTSTINISEIPEAMTAGSWSGNMRVYVRLLSSGEGAEYAEKVDLMNDLTFHLAGDSVMEGYKNDYSGVGDHLTSMWGSDVSTDYSMSGALMTKYSNNNTSVYKSITKIAEKLDQGYTAQDVVIFDGGGNELVGYDRGDFQDVTFDFSGGSTQNDVLIAWATSVSTLLDSMNEQDVKAPIIYILPYVPQTTMYETYRNYLLGALDDQVESGVDNVFVIDMMNVISNEDYQDDGIHWRESAYKKLSNEIADVLYNYYKSQS